MVNIRTHSTDHCSKTGGLGKVRDNLSAFNTSIVVLINKQWFDDDQNLVNIGADQVIQFVEDSIDDLHQQMALLVFQSPFHEQGENLVEKSSGTKVARIVCDLTQSSLTHGRCAVLDLEQ